MLKKILIFIIPLFVLTGTISAQPDSLWSQTYGGEGDDWAESLIQTADGGFALGGGTESFGAGMYDMWMVKTNANGDSLWSRRFGGGGDDWCESLIQTVDGGYVLAGYTDSYGAGESDMWIVKTNADGDSLWSRTFGGERFDGCKSILQTADGGFALGGYTGSFGNGGMDMWMLKTNANGDSLWSRTFGGMGTEIGRSIIQTDDEDIIIAGSTNFNGHMYSDMYMVKTNAEGASRWTRSYGNRPTEGCKSLIQTADGGFALAGYSENHILLVKTDEEGNSIWVS